MLWGSSKQFCAVTIKCGAAQRLSKMHPRGPVETPLGPWYTSYMDNLLPYLQHLAGARSVEELYEDKDMLAHAMELLGRQRYTQLMEIVPGLDPRTCRGSEDLVLFLSRMLHVTVLDEMHELQPSTLGGFFHSIAEASTIMTPAGEVPMLCGPLHVFIGITNHPPQFNERVQELGTWLMKPGPVVAGARTRPVLGLLPRSDGTVAQDVSMVLDAIMGNSTYRAMSADMIAHSLSLSNAQPSMLSRVGVNAITVVVADWRSDREVAEGMADTLARSCLDRINMLLPLGGFTSVRVRVVPDALVGTLAGCSDRRSQEKMMFAAGSRLGTNIANLIRDGELKADSDDEDGALLEVSIPHAGINAQEAVGLPAGPGFNSPRLARMRLITSAQPVRFEGTPLCRDMALIADSLVAGSYYGEALRYVQAQGDPDAVRRTLFLNFLAGVDFAIKCNSKRSIKKQMLTEDVLGHFLPPDLVPGYVAFIYRGRDAGVGAVMQDICCRRFVAVSPPGVQSVEGYFGYDSCKHTVTKPMTGVTLLTLGLCMAPMSRRLGHVDCKMCYLPTTFHGHDIPSERATGYVNRILGAAEGLSAALGGTAGEYVKASIAKYTQVYDTKPGDPSPFNARHASDGSVVLVANTNRFAGPPADVTTRAGIVEFMRTPAGKRFAAALGAPGVFVPSQPAGGQPAAGAAPGAAAAAAAGRALALSAPAFDGDEFANVFAGSHAGASERVRECLASLPLTRVPAQEHCARPGAFSRAAPGSSCADPRCCGGWEGFFAEATGADGHFSRLEVTRRALACHPSIHTVLASDAAAWSPLLAASVELLLSGSCAPRRPPRAATAPPAMQLLSRHGAPLAMYPLRTPRFGRRLPVRMAPKSVTLNVTVKGILSVAVATSCRAGVSSARERVRTGDADAARTHAESQVAWALRRMLAASPRFMPPPAAAAQAESSDESESEDDGSDADSDDDEAPAAAPRLHRAPTVAEIDAAAAAAAGASGARSLAAVLIAGEADGQGALCGVVPSTFLRSAPGVALALAQACFVPSGLRNQVVRMRIVVAAVAAIVRAELPVLTGAQRDAALAILDAAAAVSVTLTQRHAEQSHAQKVLLRLARTDVYACLTGTMIPPAAMKYVATVCACEARHYMMNMATATDEERIAFCAYGAVLAVLFLLGRQTSQSRMTAGIHLQFVSGGGMAVREFAADAMAATHEADKVPGKTNTPMSTSVLTPALSAFTAALLCANAGGKTWAEACAAGATLFGASSPARAIAAVFAHLTGEAHTPAHLRRYVSTAIDDTVTAQAFEEMVGGGATAQAAMAALLRDAQPLVLHHGNAVAMETYLINESRPWCTLDADAAARAALALPERSAAVLAGRLSLDDLISGVATRVYVLAPQVGIAMFPFHIWARYPSCLVALAEAAARPRPRQRCAVLAAATARAAAAARVSHATGMPLNLVTEQRALVHACLMNTEGGALRAVRGVALAAATRGLSAEQVSRLVRRFDRQRGAAAVHVVGVAVGAGTVDELLGSPPAAPLAAAANVVAAPVAKAPIVTPAEARAARAFEFTAALGPDGGRALYDRLVAAATPIGGSAAAAAAIAGQVLATAARFHFGTPALGIAPGTSVASLLLGPPEALAAFVPRMRAAAGSSFGCKAAARLVRLMRAEGERIRAVIERAPPSAAGARALAALAHADNMLTPLATSMHRDSGGSAASASAANATARMLAAMASLPAVGADVVHVINTVADAALEFAYTPAWDARLAARRRALLPDVAFALYFLGVGVSTFRFVEDMELGATVFLLRDANGVPEWRYAPPFLIGARPRSPVCVPLPAAAQALVSWLVATLPGPSLFLFADA